LDGGFCSDRIMSCPEAKPKNRVIAAKFYRPAQRLVGHADGRTLLDAGIEICGKTCRPMIGKRPAERLWHVKRLLHARKRQAKYRRFSRKKQKSVGTVVTASVSQILHSHRRMFGECIAAAATPKTG
jgi:hypothetical protein